MRIGDAHDLSSESSVTTPLRTRPPLAWWIVLVLAVPIVGYALAYVILGERVYPPNLAASFLARPWGIYPHALFGAALSRSARCNSIAGSSFGTGPFTGR